jgi:Zn-dependent protease
MIEQLYILPILLFSVIMHEIAHGWVALKLGDPTARDAGRLTLNPVPHIDLFGSILIPLLSLAAAGRVFIAWAKPVPVNPALFSRPRRDDIAVSAAGPVSNLLVALLCTLAVVGFVILLRVAGTAEESIVNDALVFTYKMFYAGIYLNIVLALFNLLPVPPLDGSHLLAALLPTGAARRFRSVGFLGVVILIFLMRIPALGNAFFAAVDGVFTPFRLIIETIVSAYD